MKRLISAVIILVVLILIGALWLGKNNTVVAPVHPLVTPTVTLNQSPTSTVFCLPSNLQATIATEGAAGNIYGTLTITNTSQTPCTIVGDQFIEVHYSAQNLIVSMQGQKGPATLLLAPNQTVYSQIHFPNGPQCSGGITQTPVTFTYPISHTSSITFVPNSNLPASTVTICTNPNEKTQLDVWSISVHKTNQ